MFGDHLAGTVQTKCQDGAFCLRQDVAVLDNLEVKTSGTRHVCEDAFDSIGLHTSFRLEVLLKIPTRGSRARHRAPSAFITKKRTDTRFQRMTLLSLPNASVGQKHIISPKTAHLYGWKLLLNNRGQRSVEMVVL